MEYLEIKITTKPEYFEILQALLSSLEFESFVDNDTAFSGYINDETFHNKNVQQELETLKENYSFDYTILNVENKNWNEEWEKNFQPIIVDNKCLIRASFHPSIEEINDEVIITPKMSFGTGHHATTYMMVNELYNIELQNKTVLDMGCGTAVLAILAKKLGAGHTVGIDIDDWAVENSIENCQINGFENIEILKGDREKLTDFQNFDVILANINRNILLSDMKYYNSVLKQDGEIIFSGFYTEDNDLICQEAHKNNFTLIDQNERENWSLLHFRKNK